MNRPVRPQTKQKLSVFGIPWPLDPPLLRIRLKYITARFLQMPEPRISLRNTTDILRWAQQMMDDGMPRAATELVRLAIEEEPEQKKLWQFLLACAFEDDNLPEFTEIAESFEKLFPNDESSAEIDKMQRLLARGPANASNTGSYIAPDRQRSSTFFGRDESKQRAFHDCLLHAAAGQGR